MDVDLALSKFWWLSRVWNGTEKENTQCTVEEALQIIGSILCTSSRRLTKIREAAYRLQQDIIYNQHHDVILEDKHVRV